MSNPARSLANVEFHHAGDEVNEVGRRLAWAIVRGRIRLRGSPRWLLAFARCFPS